MAKKEKQTGEGSLINHAVQAGLQSLISQPGMRERAPYITNNLDEKKISLLTNEIKKEIIKKNISGKRQAEIIYEGIANYVASGQALNDKGKKVLLEKSYEGKENQSFLEKIVDFIKPSKFEGEKYFEKARNAYGDMYDILSQDKAAQQEFPELTRAAKSMKLYGFLDIALKNFKVHGMMDEKTHKKLSNKLYQKTSEESVKGIRGIEDYILSRSEKASGTYKVAASIMVIFGAILVAFAGVNITGNVIGNIPSKTSGIWGGGLILLGSILFLIAKKKHKKIKDFKN